MTTRRTFLHVLTGAIAAASATAILPRLAYSQGRTAGIKARDGTELFVKDTGGNGRAVPLSCLQLRGRGDRPRALGQRGL